MGIELGADIHVVPGFGDTPLIRAIRKELPDVVQKMLELGVDPTRKNSFGYSAMNFALKSNNSDVMKHLKDALKDTEFEESKDKQPDDTKVELDDTNDNELEETKDNESNENESKI